MTEAVRLVIWDLDDTFWKGTISEGPIEYQAELHDCVIQLAKRGIVSSICSKNDFNIVKDYLLQCGIWEYFIFPSINWEPKGHRVKSIIDLFQLRAPTVLFIDDNPINLNEVRHYVPEIQIAAEAKAADLLGNSLLRGKNDPTLSRLQQYKLLEQRKRDEAQSGGDNLAFLRESDIRVEFIYDFGSNLDRAIELINRTNQLNFTKRRLPEDLSEARTALLAHVNQYDVQAGLIRVFDRYGDYGICGFFCTRINANGSVLLDYCFSCRVLNMGIEAWLYEYLKRPWLNIVGEVLSDPRKGGAAIDWITVAPLGKTVVADGAARFNRVVLHGGCDLMSLDHYFRTCADEVIGEFNGLRGGMEVRPDHSALLRFAMSAPKPELVDALSRLGYPPETTQTILLETAKTDIIVLSFAPDLSFPIYRHKTLGHAVPMIFHPSLRGPWESMDVDLRFVDDAALNAVDLPWYSDAVAELRSHYVYEGLITPQEFQDNLRFIFGKLPQDAKVFIIGVSERSAKGDALAANQRLNNSIRTVVHGQPNAIFVNPLEFVRDTGDQDAVNPNHYGRMVYFRIFEHMLALTDQAETQQAGTEIRHAA